VKDFRVYNANKRCKPTNPQKVSSKTKV